jgi:ubiquinone/menaquinone biosynthesis C-methylase UbiE
MMPDNMSHDDLELLLQPNETVAQGGIFVAKGIAERTVWDKLSLENATHAVISAKDEEDARLKSLDQIADIKKHLTTTSVLLDFGSGYGRVAKYLLPDMTISGYVAIDSSYEMLSMFKERYIRSDEEQQTPVLFINADIHTVPLEEASVDIVIVCAVFLHNHKDVVAKAMGEIKRVLKPGGTLLVYSSFPRIASGMGLQGAAYQMFLNLMGKPFKNGPVRYYSKREVIALHTGFSKLIIKPTAFAFLPKTLIFLPRPLEVLYRNGIANPCNRLLERFLPPSIKPYFAVHYDIIATR